MSEENPAYTREGLTSYFAQSDSDNDGRVDWDIDTLVTLFLNAQFEAERRGEERGWKAARRATNGCVISMDYSEGGGPRFVAISDWRASEEYKEGK